MASTFLSLLTVPLAAVLALSAPLTSVAQSAPQKKTTGKAATRRGPARKSPTKKASASTTKVPPPPPSQLTEAQRAVLALREQDAQLEEVARAKETGAFREIGDGIMVPGRSVTENLARSLDHTLLTQALRSEAYAKLNDVTILAPTDAVLSGDERLQKNAEAGSQPPIDQYIIQGSHSLAKIERKEQWTTTLGTKLTVMRKGANEWVITDHKGGRAFVTVADVPSSNGIIHVIGSPLTAEKPASSKFVVPSKPLTAAEKEQARAAMKAANSKKQ